MFTTSFLSFLSPVAVPFKRAQQGLFHGKTRLSGNNVPFSKKKTRRTWLPNVRPKRLWSDAMGKLVPLRVTARALRCVKKAGGLDDYLLHTRADLLGYEGMRLRLLVREALEKPKAVLKSSSPMPVPEATSLVPAAAKITAQIP